MEELGRNRVVLLAFVRLLEVIGEAASKVSEQGQEAFPEIDWANIVGMRNRLIHAYFDISLVIVWRTISEDLPPLIELLRPIVGNSDP
jgi:uncharacterized protein with HEPN domain